MTQIFNISLINCITKAFKFYLNKAMYLPIFFFQENILYIV